MNAFDALVLSLPARNATVRMRVWRALKESGCAVLRDGVYVLPPQSATAEVLAQMAAQVRAAGGFAVTAELRLPKEEDAAELRRLFDRSAAYGALVAAVRKAQASLRAVNERKAQSAMRRLQHAFERLARIDFFPGQAKRQAADALDALKRDVQRAFSAAEPAPSKGQVRPLAVANYQSRVWATRKAPWVDRLASAWLIKRFIDREARFAWIERPRDCPKKAIGFDFDGARFTHADSRVTFEVLLASFGLESDPALAKIAAAVHFLDVGGIPVDDAKGLETVLRGVKEKARSDDALLAEAMRILDLFHSAYRQALER
jgi:hypothetical protein